VSADQLPDLSTMFAQVRSEAAAPVSIEHRRRHVPGRWLVAAAAVVVLGAGGGIAAVAVNSDSAPSRSVALTPFDRGTSGATVKLVRDDEVKLDATSLPALSPGEYYEVWLTDSARKTMAAIGQLDPDGKGQFSVPASVMKTYSAVEVSVQQTASTGGYSGVSVLRGSYA
jgi:hypothetical protein